MGKQPKITSEAGDQRLEEGENFLAGRRFQEAYEARFQTVLPNLLVL